MGVQILNSQQQCFSAGDMVNSEMTKDLMCSSLHSQCKSLMQVLPEQPCFSDNAIQAAK
jgi:hypothetical protein